MLFSLTNALAAFQKFMNNLFSDFLNVCVMIYLNNILIYSNNMSEHCWNIKAGLYAKAEKCKFYSKLVEYLGYCQAWFTPEWKSTEWAWRYMDL